MASDSERRDFSVCTKVAFRGYATCQQIRGPEAEVLRVSLQEDLLQFRKVLVAPKQSKPNNCRICKSSEHTA